MQPTETPIIVTGKESYAESLLQTSRTKALHEEIEIKCFYEGKATLFVGSQSIDVQAGDVVVINPYEFHATVHPGSAKGKYHLFMLPLDYFAGEPELDLQKLLIAENKAFRTVFSGDPELYGLLMKAASEAQQNQPFRSLMLKSILTQFFTLLLRYGMADPGDAPEERRSLRLYSVIEPALQCIKNEYASALTVDSLAKLCSVSKHYFCRAFKTVTKKSAMEYLRDYRLRIANTLLVNTDKSCAEIASACGFESPNYFSRCYKQHYGESPRMRRYIKE